MALLFSLLHFGGSEGSLWDIDVTFFTVNLVILGQPHVCIVTTDNYYWQPGGCTFCYCFEVVCVSFYVYVRMCEFLCMGTYIFTMYFLEYNYGLGKG